MADTLPQYIRERRTKATFVDVVSNALVERYRDSAIQDLQCVQNGWLDGDKLAKLMTDHVEQRRAGGHPRDITILSPVWFATAIDIWMTSGAA